MAGQSRWDVLDGLLRLSVRHPRSVVGLVIALTVAALAIPGVRVRLDGRSLIPENYHAQVESERAAELFDLRDVIVVGIESPLCAPRWNPHAVGRPAVQPARVRSR